MTTALTEAPIEVAGRRLNPGTSPEWQHLLTHFELSEGFSFVVLLVPDADWANACRIALSQYLEAEGKNLLTVGYSDAEDFKIRVPGRLLELHTSEHTGAVWLESTFSEASPRYEEWADAWRGMAARLNQFRNPLRRQLYVPLVFVGAHWIQPVIREIAPDLWSVRTLVTRLEPPTEFGEARSRGVEATSEQQLEGLAIDPDFALQTAARLRNQAGKELALAQLLYRAGLGLNARSRWAEAEAALREALDLQRKFSASPASIAASLKALGYSLEWQYGFDDATKLLNEARILFAEAGDVLGEANCIQSLGDIALRRSDHDTAQARYEEALPIYRRVGDKLGEAVCIARLGSIALNRSDHQTAHGRYDEALPLFRRVGDVLGEANCIRRLGDIALERSDHATAQLRYEEALPLFRRVGDVLGEANCIKCLGDIALRRSDHDTAQARYEEALPLYCRVGDVLGEANCILRLGDIAFQRSDYATAQARYEEALPLYRRVGSVLGEANCIQRLGDITLGEERPEEAKKKFFEALQLYEGIAEPFSIGWAHIRLARLAPTLAEGDEHLKAAREAWMRIDRPDLIAWMEKEFNITEGNDAKNS